MKKNILFKLLFVLALSAPAFAADTEDATVLYNKGIDLYNQNKIEESIATFKKATAINPEFYEAYYNLARIQEAAGKTQDAIASYEKLLKISPQDWDSTFQFGEYLYKKGYLSKSLSYLQRIPEGNTHKTKADALCTKIKVRQVELAEEAKVKAEQKLKSSVVGNIPAPSGLVVDSNGNMYVASFTESKIVKISKDGMTKVVFADKSKELAGPIGVAIDSYDNMYIANYTKGTVVMLDKNANAKILMYAKKPYCISLDEKRAKLYITEQQNNSVISYDLTEILKASSETGKKTKAEKDKDKEPTTPRVITVPTQAKNPIGTPSIQEASFTKGSPQTSITAPIMVPSENIFY